MMLRVCLLLLTVALPILLLHAIAQEAETKSSSTNISSAPIKPRFESSGIRGAIDPGGYSAATDATASGLLQGMTIMQRTSTRSSEIVSKEWPCALESSLRAQMAKNSGDLKAALGLGELYEAHNQPAKAIPLLEKAFISDANRDRALLDLAAAWLESSDYEKARALLVSSSDVQGDPTTHQLLARAEEGLGHFAQAAQEYRIANHESPTEESLFGIGYELMLANSMADSRAVFESGVHKYSQSIQMRMGAGAAQFFSGMNPLAIVSFLHATDLNPTDPRPYMFLANFLSAPGIEDQRMRAPSNVTWCLSQAAPMRTTSTHLHCSTQKMLIFYALNNFSSELSD